MYRPNRIGPWPIYSSLSSARIMTASSRFTASSGVGISVRPAPINVLVSDRNDGLYAFRDISLGSPSNNCLCPAILLRSDYDDVPSDGMMVSISGCQLLSFESSGRTLDVQLIFGVLGSSTLPSFPSPIVVGSGSYRVLPSRSTVFECPEGHNCYLSQVSWNGSIIVPGGHTNPFYVGFLTRNLLSGATNSTVNIEGTLSASVYRGDLDVFDPVR